MPDGYQGLNCETGEMQIQTQMKEMRRSEESSSPKYIKSQIGSRKFRPSAYVRDFLFS